MIHDRLRRSRDATARALRATRAAYREARSAYAERRTTFSSLLADALSRVGELDYEEALGPLRPGRHGFLRSSDWCDRMAVALRRVRMIEEALDFATYERARVDHARTIRELRPLDPEQRLPRAERRAVAS